MDTLIVWMLRVVLFAGMLLTLALVVVFAMAIVWGTYQWIIAPRPKPEPLRVRMRRRGLCPDCGYEVLAMERCPECGLWTPPIGAGWTSRGRR